MYSVDAIVPSWSSEEIETMMCMTLLEATGATTWVLAPACISPYQAGDVPKHTFYYHDSNT